MINSNLNDTIAAISTPVGEGGIGIVRLSGSCALKIADKVFASKDPLSPSGFKSYTTHYGWVIDEKKNIVDEVILTVMRSPKSFTREDVVEINCHGGIVALRAVLGLVLENGCRLAEAGEFTKRAFLNGRIDLAQAEAVVEIIRAKTDSTLKMGLEQLKGGLSLKINRICASLLEILSPIEARIDFPDEEIPAQDASLKKSLKNINDELLKIIEDSKRAKVFREGIHTVICGRPNVGKSSLLNALLRQERSIVTPVAGTTRDTIEEIIDIKGIPVRIVDTAGILEPRDLIERKAVQRSKKHIEMADLVLLMFDASKSLTKEDEALIRKLKGKRAIAVINKIDLKQKINKSRIADKIKNIVEVSAKKGKNIDLLEEAIAGLVFEGKIVVVEPLLVSNARHVFSIKDAQKLVAQAIDSVDNKLSIEFIAQDIKEALSRLEDILGKRFSEDLLNKIFRDFCIGK